MRGEEATDRCQLNGSDKSEQAGTAPLPHIPLQCPERKREGLKDGRATRFFVPKRLTLGNPGLHFRKAFRECFGLIAFVRVLLHAVNAGPFGVRVLCDLPNGIDQLTRSFTLVAVGTYPFRDEQVRLVVLDPLRGELLGRSDRGTGLQRNAPIVRGAID